MKTNREKNMEHDARAKARVRPAPKEWNWEPLQAAINQMIRSRHEQTRVL